MEIKSTSLEKCQEKLRSMYVHQNKIDCYQTMKRHNVLQSFVRRHVTFEW